MVHVDIDPAEIGKNVKTDVPVVGDAREVLKLLIPELDDANQHDEWMAWIESQRNCVLEAALEERPEYARAVHDHQGDRRSDQRRSDLSPPMSGSIRCGPRSTSVWTTRTDG